LRSMLTDEEAVRVRDALRLLSDSRRGIDSLIEELAWTPKELGYAFRNFVEVKRTRERGTHWHRSVAINHMKGDEYIDFRKFEHPHEAYYDDLFAELNDYFQTTGQKMPLRTGFVAYQVS